MTLVHRLTVPATHEAVRDLAAAAVAAAAEHGLSAQSAADLELALVETANNMVTHGGAGDDGNGIALWVGRPALTIELRSGGVALPGGLPGRIDLVDLWAESGRGLWLMRACVDEMDYERRDGCNVWRLVKRPG